VLGVLIVFLELEIKRSIFYIMVNWDGNAVSPGKFIPKNGFDAHSQRRLKTIKKHKAIISALCLFRKLISVSGWG
jgi:hypothetical protein